MVAAPTHPEFGPWNPGIQSQVPVELRPLATIFRPENSRTSYESALELEQLTGFPPAELVAFHPRRLALHELLIRVTADVSVPDGARIEDLGINFREIIRSLLASYVEPEMDNITAAYEQLRRELSGSITTALSDVIAEAGGSAADSATARPSLFSKLLGSRGAPVWRRHNRAVRRLARDGAPASSAGWGLRQITECELRAAAAADRAPAATSEAALQNISYRCLARVMSALFSVHGQPWGTRELIVSVATDMACNIQGSQLIGELIDPILRRAAAIEGYTFLPRQLQPVVINTKGPSASGKSSLRPLQRHLAGVLGIRWSDFALISPDIWRKQLLDYGSLGTAYKYAGALTSEELQIIDQKLDRYMAQKQRRGAMSHFLIDRFRFDSFAADSAEAGSNLLTRFGHSVYLFFMITPPELLVERAWKRGLEVGRYKAVDDTLAHSVEAYTGMPNVFFTWVRSDKRIHFEFLDNSVRFGDLPRTVAFGSNDTLHVLDVSRMLDIERFGRVNVDARNPQSLYPEPRLLAPENNLGLLRKCIEEFREVVFADQASGRIYLRMVRGAPVQVDRGALQLALADPDARASLQAIAPQLFDSSIGAGTAGADNARSTDHLTRSEVRGQPALLQYLNEPPNSEAFPTIGQWGRATR
jgi:hypothetical protein